MFIVKSGIKCLLIKLGVLTLKLHTNAVFSPGRGLAGFPQEKTEMAH